MNQKNLDIDYLSQWIGSEESIEQTISAEPLHRMAATLDQAPKHIVDGTVVPALWHWACFLNPIRASELGRDGHAAPGGFMPPVPLPRRMWAGGQLKFSTALRVGELARRQSTVRDIKLKQGRTGKLCFVEVEHRILVGEELRLSEIHNIVYRDIKHPDEATVVPPKAPIDAQWTREVVPDSTLLFRYSAVTFNGHRIHYDIDYCRDEEGYPGLVFHGPLTATMLLELAMAKNHNQLPDTFEFRAYSPLFDNAPFTLNGKMDGGKAIMWASNPENRLAMQATVVFAT